MKVNSELNWRGGMAFDVSQDGHTIVIDANREVGGEDLGVRPKKLMLTALGGCAGMDIVSILKKMRVEFDSFKVSVEATHNTEEHPYVYEAFEMTLAFEGENLENSIDKIKKAVELTNQKYCGASAMYSAFTSVDSKIVVNGVTI